jgi:LacI family xylobiose transport system transcriptional regulator
VSRNGRVTLRHIAAQTGVSLTTISKVLNGAPDVASATRELVEEQLRHSGYRRRTAHRRRDYLEVVLHALEGEWSFAVVEGVREAAAREGLTISLAVSGDRHAPGADWLEGVMRRRPAAVVLLFAGITPEARAQLEARGIPSIIIDPAGDPAPNIPSVGAANWSGGLSATRHLIDLGHRRIGAITGPPAMMCAEARLDGYRTAMRAAGLPVAAEWERYGDFHRGAGELLAREMLALPEPPTAIFAGSDAQAIGVMHAVKAAGLDVPGDVSIVGFDDLSIAELTDPKLTTVRQPLREMAEQATNLVLRLPDEPALGQMRIELATTLVVRESTAAPPHRRP